MATSYNQKATVKCCCQYSVRLTLECNDCTITFKNEYGNITTQTNKSTGWSINYIANQYDYYYVYAESTDLNEIISINLYLGSELYHRITLNHIAILNGYLPD